MSTDLNNSILNRLFHISRIMRRKADRMEGMSELTLLQMQALFFVKHHVKPMMRDFADELKISPSSASLLADRLITAGWLEREADSEDRRIIYLRFSEHAEKKMDEIHKRSQMNMGQLLDTIDPHDLTEFDRILKSMEDALEPNLL